MYIAACDKPEQGLHVYTKESSGSIFVGLAFQCLLYACLHAPWLCSQPMHDPHCHVTGQHKYNCVKKQYLDIMLGEK